MEVEIIKAKGAGEDTSTGRKIDRLRVAAYCRVSTDDEDQIKSYNSMVRYYTDLIKSNKQWVFAGVFADKAITGTKTDKREEFQLLIQECLSGNIDLVIAKSIPRFARNTLDTLKYVRMLRERNIAVYFEVEKINTLKDGEFLLTILSSVAQQEVENTSAYVKKGLKMKMKRGELVGFQGCLGYDYDVVTKSLSINEEGAETVRYIFDRYVAGAGSTMIARELNEQGISTIKGNLWTSSSVMGIINNEKYKGDILLGKTFTVDPISKRRLENLGEEDRFYIKNHHEPIISEEKFARAQEIRERRNGGRKKGVAPGKREKFSRQYAFSCMLECGFCGASLSRRRWHSSSKYKKTIWQCVKSTKHGKRFCPDSKGIPEQVIEDAFIESYRMLCTDHKDVLEEFIKRVEKTLSEDSIEDKIEKLNKNAYNIQYKRKKLLESYLEGVVAKDIYEETDMGYEKKLSEVNAQLGMLEQQYDNEGSLQRRLVDFRKALSKNQILEGFDRGIFESIIEKVIVGGYDENGEKDPYKIIFIYKTGFKNEIGNAKERFGKKSKAVEKAKEMCSHIADEVKDVCSYVSDNTAGDQSSTGHHSGQHGLFAMRGREYAGRYLLCRVRWQRIQRLCQGALCRRHGTVHKQAKERQLDQQRRAGKRQQGSSACKADTKDDTIEQCCTAQQDQSGAHGSGQHPAQCQCKQLPSAVAQNTQTFCKCTAKALALQQKFWQHHKSVQKQRQYAKRRQCKQQTVARAGLQQPPQVFRHGKLRQMICCQKKVCQRDQSNAIHQQRQVLRQKYPNQTAEGIPEHRSCPQRRAVPYPRQQLQQNGDLV